MSYLNIVICKTQFYAYIIIVKFSFSWHTAKDLLKNIFDTKFYPELHAAFLTYCKREL